MVVFFFEFFAGEALASDTPHSLKASGPQRSVVHFMVQWQNGVFFRRDSQKQRTDGHVLCLENLLKRDAMRCGPRPKGQGAED